MGREFIFLSRWYVTTCDNSDNFASRFPQTRADDEFVTATTRRRKPQHEQTRDTMQAEQSTADQRIAEYYRDAFETRGEIIKRLSEVVQDCKESYARVVINNERQRDTIAHLNETILQLRAELSEAKQAVLLGILDC
jgi:hypothetical protein